jgi:hypothetical protein
MNLTTLTTRDLARIQKLIERKEALGEQIAAIDAELDSIDAGAPLPSPAGSRAARGAAAPKAARAAKGRKAKGGKTGRGELKARISDELMSAGSQGVKVKDLAARLGTSYGNVTAFFQTTGKKMQEIKKVGPAQFAWAGA